jgi:hypothetical protein
MSWTVTHSGQVIDLVNINPDHIDPRDLAKALSRQPYLGGHTSRPVNMAEQAVLVSMTLAICLQVQDTSVLLAGLMHNAARALISTPDQAMHERRAALAIAHRFNVFTAATSAGAKLQLADAMVERTIRRDLMPPVGCFSLPEVPAAAWISHGEPNRAALDPWEWEGRFMRRYLLLEQARAVKARHIAASSAISSTTTGAAHHG